VCGYAAWGSCAPFAGIARVMLSDSNASTQANKPWSPPRTQGSFEESDNYACYELDGGLISHKAIK